jgi:hypothetical protein
MNQTLDARPLRLVLAYGVLKRYPVHSRNRAQPKPTPCVCPDYPHPFCATVTCRCDHGIGAP